MDTTNNENESNHDSAIKDSNSSTASDQITNGSTWPENDSSHYENHRTYIGKLFHRYIVDAFFYSYMNPVLQKGAHVHKHRILFMNNSCHHDTNTSIDTIDNANANGADANFSNVQQELSFEDLFAAPQNIQAHELQTRFWKLYNKQHDEFLRQKNKTYAPEQNVQQITMDKKMKRWIFIKVLWEISKPTYLYAGFYQLTTVLIEALYPLAVQHLLRLFENEQLQNVENSTSAHSASTNFVIQGVGFAIILFLCSVMDGLAQERHKYLSFQSGITIRAATTNAIYHHLLSLTSKGKEDLLAGETINLVAIDCQKLFEVCQEGHLIWSCPLSMVIVTILLLVTLGPSTLVGMASMFLMVPLVKLVVGRMMKIRRRRASFTDKRVDTTTSMLQAIRFCKLNHYESKFLKRVHDSRNEEMYWVRRELQMIGLTMFMTVITPVIASYLTFITYALIDENNILTSSDTFTTLLLFSGLRFPINYAGKLMGKIAQGLEACQRLSQFLDRETAETKVISLDSKENHKYSHVRQDSTIPLNDDDPIVLEVKNGCFIVGGVSNNNDVGHSNEGVPDLLSIASFTVSDVNFTIRQSETLAVVGTVGCGKSTLIHGLIGDVKQINESSSVRVHGKIAYASQTPFILNATLRDNILFGLEYDKELYDKVLESCNLLPDLKQIGPARDLTEIGERGVTLSGGQKARISIARCVYAQPSIAIFDDVLSALDASTGKWIFEHLFDSKNTTSLLSKSGVLLVTHASHFLSRVDKILVLSKGRSIFHGNWETLVSFEPDDEEIYEVISSIRSSVQENNDNADDEETSDSKISPRDLEVHDDTHKDEDNGVLMTEEERDFGLTDWRTWFAWFKVAGGIFFILTAIICMGIDRVFYVACEWWVAVWTNADTEPAKRFGKYFAPQSDGSGAQREYVKVYSIILCISLVGTFTRSQLIILGGARAAEKLFHNMTSRIIKAPMSYFETTPLGRILNRLTYDVEILDISLSQSMTTLITSSGWFITGVTLQTIILPWSLCILLPVIVSYWLVLRFYRKSSVDLQRLDAISRSPVQALLSEGIDGSSTIRVFGQINHFENKFKDSLDISTSSMMNFMTAQRWLGSRFQLLGSFVVLFAALVVVIWKDQLGLLKDNTGLIAILLIWASNFTVTLSFFSQSVSDTEAYLTSVERVRFISELPQENNFETLPASSCSDQIPPESWPSEGHLSFHNVCLRYRPGLPLALKGLTFTALPGQRVGICGRTGAGKSTIAVALFRLAEVDSGSIILDGYDLSKLTLADVRGRKNGMCIIPQDPVLFSGSIRECLDPWQQCTDDEINNALFMVNLSSKKISSYVDEGGRNFSVGERQLLCLARAILAKPKVLVLDEATASVDNETDSFIQKMIRQRFKGTTILTIAHRLNTIMDYDTVLVMEGGTVAEYGHPKKLLENKNGKFSVLVDSTGKESSVALRKMVK